MDGLLIGAECVGGDAVVSSVVVDVDVNNAQTQRQLVVAVVVRLDAVLARTDDATAVLLPVVDGVRVRRYATFEDRLEAARLPEPRRRHRYLGTNWQQPDALHNSHGDRRNTRRTTER